MEICEYFPMYTHAGGWHSSFCSGYRYHGSASPQRKPLLDTDWSMCYVITLVSHIPSSPSSPSVDADLMKSCEYILYAITASHSHHDLFDLRSRWVFNVVHGVIVGYGLVTLASKPKMRFGACPNIYLFI